MSPHLPSQQHLPICRAARAAPGDTSVWESAAGKPGLVGKGKKGQEKEKEGMTGSKTRENVKTEQQCLVIV